MNTIRSLGTFRARGCGFSMSRPFLLLATLLLLLAACGRSQPEPEAAALVADAGDDATAVAGETVALDGSRSSGEAGIAAWQWTQSDGPQAVDIRDADQPVAEFDVPPTAESGAVFVFALTVTDNHGNSASDTTRVIITTVPNQPPVADAGADQNVVSGDEVTLDGSTSQDPDGEIVAWTWVQVDGISVELQQDTGDATASFTAPEVTEAAELTFRLTVTDDDGAQASDETTVTVAPRDTVEPAGPSANAGPDQQAESGDDVTLDGSGSEAGDAEIVAYQWQQTGGEPEVELSDSDQAVASFTAPEVEETTELVFQLTVTDDNGKSATDTTTVTVEPKAAEQPAIACQTGLTEPGASATVYVDPWGVPHIESEDAGSMAYAFGYEQASDRLFLMDAIRRIGQGRLSELLGEGAYNADVVMRREFYDADDFDRQIAELPEVILCLLQRYADGVNQAIVEQVADPTQLPALYVALGDVPQPWTVHDSATVLNLFTAVSFAASGEGGELDNIERYLNVLDLHGDDGNDVWDDVMWSVDPDMVSVIPDADAAPVPDGYEGLDTVRPHPNQLALAETSGDSLSNVEAAMRAQMDALREVIDQLPVPKIGSYAIAIGGNLTASGGAVLLGAPQAGMTFPSTFHEVGIQTPGWACQGMTVPGLGPFIGIGWCNDHAWTLVAGNAGDQVDVYVETLDPTDPSRYLFEDESVPFEERTETFVVKSTLDALVDIRQETFEYSGHGAVFARDDPAGVAFTTRRAQTGRVVTNFNGLLVLNTASQGVPQIMDALDRFTASYNITLADTDGNIAYAFTGLQPIRAEGYDHRFGMPGTGEAEWRGFVAAEQMPRVINPTGDLLVVNQGVESKPVKWWPASSRQQIGRINRVAANHELLQAHESTANRAWDAQTLAVFDRALIEREEPYARRFAGHVDALFAELPAEDALQALRPHWEAWRDAGFLRVDEAGDNRFDHPGVAIFQPDRYYGMPASPLWGELHRLTVGQHLPPGGHGWSHYFARLSLLERVLAGDETLSRNYVDNPETDTEETVTERLREALEATLPLLETRFGSADPQDWLEPITTISFDVVGIAGPRAMIVLDHGTYNYVVDLGLGDARSILPPGNAGANAVIDEAGFQVTGDLPRHANDQIDRYETWDHKPMHRTDYRDVAEDVRTVIPLPLP